MQMVVVVQSLLLLIKILQVTQSNVYASEAKFNSIANGIAGLQKKGHYCNENDSFERLCGGNNWWCSAGSAQAIQVLQGYNSLGGT